MGRIFFAWFLAVVCGPALGGPLINEFLPDPDQVQWCSKANLAARLAMVRGDRELARRFVDYALGKGFFQARFIAFCKRYELCDVP